MVSAKLISSPQLGMDELFLPVRIVQSAASRPAEGITRHVKKESLQHVSFNDFCHSRVLMVEASVLELFLQGCLINPKLSLQVELSGPGRSFH